MMQENFWGYLLILEILLYNRSVFLHYTNKVTKGSKDNKFDKRAHLGLPSWFKK